MDTSNLMEQIVSSENLNRAYLQAVRNKGAEGVDGMKYTELGEHLVKNGEIIKEQFHGHSYGFRPNRCAQQAILMALDMMNDENDWIVDIDLEKSSDTVNHDRLMTIIGRTIKGAIYFPTAPPTRFAAGNKLNNHVCVKILVVKIIFAIYNNQKKKG